MKLEKALTTIQKTILVLIAFFVPLSVSTLFPDFYTLPKLVVLVIGILLVILLATINLVKTGKAQLSLSKLDVAILGIVIAYLLSTIIKTPNKMDAFFYPGVATFVLAGFLLYLFINQFEGLKSTVRGALVISALAASVIYLLSYVGLFAKVPQLAGLVTGNSFSVFGDNLTLAIFVGTSLILVPGILMREKDIAIQVFMGLTFVIMSLALVLIIGSLLPGKTASLQLPSFRTSWFVASDSIKESPLFGMGIGGYQVGFNKYRDLAYNSTNLWNVRFSTGRNYFLTFVTETGLIGLAALLFCLVTIFLTVGKKLQQEVASKNFSSLALVALVILFALFPAMPGTIFLLFVLLALATPVTHRQEFHSPKLGRIVVAVIILALTGLLSFFGGKAVLAEYEFNRSLVYLKGNKGKDSYDTIRRAIGLNPLVDRYHGGYAQLNLALARTIAQKQNITDEERQTITQLIQQGIREGKTYVILNPQKSGNWELLGKIYQSIMPFAQGADRFAIQSLGQAVALDPLNPNLRINLGGVYYALGDYDNAIESYKLAVLAKPDLPNSHYNLAIAYREKKEYEKAISEMNTVLSLLDKNSEDYKVAQKELENLEKFRPAKTNPEPTENLNPPQETKPAIKPQLELPEDLNPPAPTPTP